MNKVIVEFLRQPNLTANQNVAATYKRYVAAGKRGSRANNYAKQILGFTKEMEALQQVIV